MSILKKGLLAAAIGSIAIGGALTLSTSASANGRDHDNGHHGAWWWNFFNHYNPHYANPETIAARNKFFGAENVDQRSGNVRKDKVIVSWLTNATLAASIKGHIVLMDSYLNRPEVAPASGPDLRRTPIDVDDMVAIMPEAIFLGHGHGDHADNAAYIAKNSKAIIYSSPETCDVMQQDVARLWADPNAINGGGRLIPDPQPVNCVGVVSRGSVPGAEVVTLDQFQPEVGVIAFKHIHSGSVPTDTDFNAVPVINDSDSRETSIYPNTLSLIPPTSGPAQPGQMNLQTTGFGGTAGAISLFYEFVTCNDNNFTLVWHNTTGPLKEGAGTDPGLPSPAVGAKLYSIMDKLPNTDVEFGSVVSLGYATNGERDIITYLQHLKPQIFVNLHTTDVAKISSSLRFKKAYLQTMAQNSNPSPSGTTYVKYEPEIRWWVDPDDFMRPVVFDPSDSRWSDRDKSQRVDTQRYANNKKVCH